MATVKSRARVRVRPSNPISDSHDEASLSALGALRSALSSLLLPEDFFQQLGRAGGRIRPDLLLFLAQHMEKAVEALRDDILIQVQRFDLQEWNTVGLTQ